jgi:hypothetical protein
MPNDVLDHVIDRAAPRTQQPAPVEQGGSPSRDGELVP